MDTTLHRWTRAHTLCLLALFASIPGLALAAGFGSVLSSLLAAAVVLALWTTGLVTSPVVGLIGGIFGSAAIVMLRFLDPGMASMGLLPLGAIIASMTATGVYAGLFGRRLRWDARPTYLPEPSVYPNDPVLGPHGFLSEEYGTIRLEEEARRAARHGRPLSLLGIRVTPLEQNGTMSDFRDEAPKMVAQSVEGLLRDTDVPFAVTESDLFCVLPETSRSKADLLLSLIVDLLAGTQVTIADREQTVPLPSVVEISVSLACHGEDGETADELLDAARRIENQRLVQTGDEQVLNAEATSDHD